MKKILVASTNKGKLAELKAMLDFKDVEWFTLADFPNIEEVEEDGATFTENARKKAVGYARQTGLWTIADDSGLMIDALGGAPGVNSARFSGPKLPGEERTLIDHRNIQKVLELLKDVPPVNRIARFVSYICLASPEGVLAESQGQWEGIIGCSEQGSSGFGYDPVMFIPEMGKTVAQMSPDEKNKLSHRYKAIAGLKPKLKALL